MARQRYTHGGWRTMESLARLCRLGRQPSSANPRGKPGSRPSKAAAEERRTVCWREMDSNFRFRARRNQEISVSHWSSTDLVYGTVARISAEPSGRHTREQYRADKCPVDGEGPSREALEDAQKAPDRGDPDRQPCCIGASDGAGAWRHRKRAYDPRSRGDKRACRRNPRRAVRVNPRLEP